MLMSVLKKEWNNATIEELEDISAALGEQMARLKKETTNKEAFAKAVSLLNGIFVRFYGISALYLANVEERDIQYITGHSSITTTRGYDRSKRTGPTQEQLEMALG